MKTLKMLVEVENSKIYVYSYDSLHVRVWHCKFVIYRFSILGKYYD
jgi:hypothetical protein